MTVVNTPLTSFRFSTEEIELLDAWAVYRHTNRTEVLRWFLHSITPPQDLSSEARGVRVAHKALEA